MRHELGNLLTGTLLTVRDAARLLARHGVPLLVLFLLGLAARNAIMWAAVLLGRDHPVAASLLVPLAPLAVVTALVAMFLRLARDVGLPAPTGARGRFALVASALVPFLAVYTAQGHLDEDRAQFLNESYTDTFRNIGMGSGVVDDRSILTVTSWQVGLIVVALVVRYLLDRLDLPDRSTVFAVVAAVVEVTWLTWLATLGTARWNDGVDWVSGLVVVDAVATGWGRLVDVLGPLGAPFVLVADGVGRLLGEVGAIVVVPVAWLAVAAVVLASDLRDRAWQAPPLAGRAETLRDRVAGVRLSERRREQARTAFGRKFEELIRAGRLIVHAGLLPVLAFCLVYPLARVAEWGAAAAIRAL
ncbi:MAG: hypothetical protein ACXWDM_09925, partial [Nocardioides sp.]